MARSVARKPKAPVSRAPERAAAAPSRQAASEAAPFAHAGPVFGLGTPVQSKLAIGQVNDPYEREAESVADRITAGANVAPQSISTLSPGALPTAKRPDEKTPAQKAPKQPEPEKKPTAGPVQKADKEPEKKPASNVQKAADGPEPKSKDKPVQKAESTPKPEKKPASNVQKAGAAQEPKPKDKPVQKAGAAPAPEKKPETKPGAKPVQKADDKKPEKQKPEEKKPVQKADQGDGKKKDDAKPVQRAVDKPAEKQMEKPVQKAGEKDSPDKKPVQKAEAKREDDKKPVQKNTAAGTGKDSKDAKEKPVQKAEAKTADRNPKSEATDDRAKDKEDESERERSREADSNREPGRPGASAPAIQTEPAAGPAAAAPASNVAEQAISQPGPGKPLAPDTRSTLESGLGTDLSGVRVHDDRAAQESARALHARAFTNQNDIWLGAGESQHDLHLMAHEATHVLQQSDAVQRQAIQRAWEPDTPTGPAVDLDAKKVRAGPVQIPSFKAGSVPAENHSVRSIAPRTNTTQTWKSAVKSPVETALGPRLANVPGVKRDTGTGAAVEDRTNDPNKIYFFKIGSTNNYVIGNQSQLADELSIPRWGPAGQETSLDVDHWQELQLGGADNVDNMWLFNSSANRSSGSRIARQIRTAIANATSAQTGEGKRWPTAPSIESLVNDDKFTVEFPQIAPTLSGGAGDPSAFWEKDKILKLDPLDKLTPVPINEVSNQLLGSNTEVVVFPASGGRPKKVAGWNIEAGSQNVGNGWLKGLHGGVVSYQPGAGGSVRGTLKGKKGLEDRELTLPLTEIAGLPFTTTIDRGALLPSMRFAEFSKLSPIEFDDAGYDEGRGFYAHGQLRPSLPILQGTAIDVWVDADGITFSKTFTKDNFSIPGPVQITEASVTLGVGTGGLSADGSIGFEISRLGKGRVTARIGSDGGFELGGSFDFDSELFEPANIRVGYAAGKWTGGGSIGIPEGKVRGIRSANLTVDYNDGVITANGSVQPKIPGVQQAGLNVRYSEQEGLIIGGTLQLAEAPGIRSGSIEVTLTKTDRWKVTATGTAVPNVPGISSSLTIRYDDGAFDASATADYAKGMLSGSVQVGVTNRPVTEGQPAGEPGETLTLYGGGRLTIKVAPWLQGTVGIRLLPNGELEVSGEIGLPSSLEIFPRKEINKSLFGVATQIPIFPGIVAEIGGNLGAVAGIGPAVIDQLRLGITYNPSHEENTTITGDAHLRIPADAGLRLAVRAGIGLGITGASATGGLEIGGTLGIEGAAEAGVHIAWSPSQGLTLDSEVSVRAQPSFTFDISGYVAVTALGFSVYDKTWRFASLRLGSNYQFGIRLPIHYREGQDFNISLDDVQFEVPDISTDEILHSLIDRIA